STYATAWHERPTRYLDPLTLLILDECHHCNERANVNASIYRRYTYSFGVSASPWSPACISLFEKHHTYSLKDAIKDGVNCGFELLDDAPIGPDTYQLVFCPTSMKAQQMGRELPKASWVLYDVDDATGRIQ